MDVDDLPEEGTLLNAPISTLESFFLRPDSVRWERSQAPSHVTLLASSQSKFSFQVAETEIDLSAGAEPVASEPDALILLAAWRDRVVANPPSSSPEANLEQTVTEVSFQFPGLTFSSGLFLDKHDPIARKVGFDLVSLHDEYEGFSIATSDISGFSPTNSLLQVSNGGVVIDAIAVENGAALLAELETLGLDNGASFGKVVSGWLPMTAIDALAQLDNLQFARPSYQPFTNIGSVTSQADPALEADVARTSFGVDGSGIKIGILSDSYNNLDGEAAAIATGDLPGPGNPFGNTTPVEVLVDLGGGGIDEGRAMAELIHDIAPGAELAFRTAFRGAADFANGILELVAAGADVIVDDIGYLTQPFFQDGIIAQAADAAAAAGVPYFSAAGNSGRNSYQSAFRDSGTVLSVFGSNDSLAHDFDPGPGVDILQEFTLAPGETITLSFQWNQPHAQAGGTGAANDMDIFVLNRAGNRILTGSAFRNVGGDAVEFFSLQNGGSFTRTFNLLLTQYLPAGGPTPGFVKYIDFDGGSSGAEFATNSSTSFGHPIATNAAGVGAAFYQDTPAFGTNPPILEPFSSAGGTPILFDTDGNRLARPDIRPQPRFTAPDGTNTTFFIPGLDVEGDGFPNFFGTSAAAPHAAAVAALMLEAAGGAGSLTPEQVYTALENTAIDMGTPGFDFDSGFGLIQADAAVAAVAQPIVIPGTNEGDTLIGTAADEIFIGGLGGDVLTGNGGSDQFVYESSRDLSDVITDFIPGDDQIVLTDLFNELSINADFSTAVANGNLQLSERGSTGDTIVFVDPDGSVPDGQRAIPMLLVQGVDPVAMNDAANFVI